MYVYVCVCIFVHTHTHITTPATTLTTKACRPCYCRDAYCRDVPSSPITGPAHRRKAGGGGPGGLAF